MRERVDQVLAALPRGNLLDDVVWETRHRLLLWVLLAHVPGLTAVAMATSHTSGTLAILLGPVVAGLAVGTLARGRAVRSVAVTAGLITSSSALIYLTGGAAEARFHPFVVIGLVALYQDWRPYLGALVYLVVGHGILLLAASVAPLILWKQAERQQAVANAYHAKLYEGERAVASQLRQAQMVKDQLIGIVGHEFRTPLTSVQGFARTLEARWDRMDAEAAQACAQAIAREARRMTRMVANLLTASEEVTVSRDDRAGLHHVAAAACDEVAQLVPTAASNVMVQIPEDHVVAVRPDVATQLLFNLVDNAVKFALPDSTVRVTSRVQDGFAVVEVANVGDPISPADHERIFDAFVQADSSDTRRYGGMGLGLHIVRKIVDAYGGRASVYSEGQLVIFRTWLPLAEPARPARESPLTVELDLTQRAVASRP